MSPDYRITESALRCFAHEALTAAGADPEAAEQVAANLVQGEVHGMGSHGVSRLLGIYCRRIAAGGINPRPQIRVVQRDRSAAVVDGDRGPGAMVGEYAMRLALELAGEHASGWVSVRDSSHYGAAFLYARMALERGMIGISATSAVPMVVPHGGRTRALGTNPISIAVPGGRRGPIVLDMATSTVARGKVQLMALEGKEIPLGWAVDRDGRPTTSSQAAVDGAMLPLGGPKGYGLALVVDVLCALLSGAAFGDRIGQLFSDLDQGQDMGHFFGALDISAFTPLEAFKERMDALVDYLKSAPRAEGVDEIMLPGEPEARKALAYRREGIPMPEDVLRTLDELAEELGIARLRRA